MAQSFLKRAMELIKYDTIETAKSYTSNLQDLKNDAKAVANQFQEDTAAAAQKSQEAYKRIKSGRIVKDLTDWFYNSAAEAESENNNDNPDDFDPGVDFNGKSSENDNDEQPTVTLPSVADSSKQIAAMYKIGAKQAEASIANTAELVATFNTRSAEIIASVTKVNESVLFVEKRLSELIEITKAGAKANEENILALNRSIVDERGNINLSKLYDTAKGTNRITKNAFTDFLSIAATAFNGATPESFFHDMMDLARSNIPIKGKSINDWGEEFNELTGSLSQTLIRSILNNDHVKKILGDTIHTGTEGRDYSEFRVNRYDEKAAVFDGMTRQSIVTIIPGYLKSIDEHLRGRSLNIDEYGELTDKAIEKNQFAKVTRNAFDGATISNRAFNKVSSQIKSTGFDINDEDIEIASKALMATYVMSMENSGASTLVDSEINANDVGIISYAVSLIQNAVGGDSNYWSMVCRNILFMLEVSVVERNKFIKNVNKSSRAMQQQAMEVASSAKYGNQATTINDSMLFDTFKDVYGKEHQTSVSPYNNNQTNNGGGSPSPNTPNGSGPNASEIMLNPQQTGLAVVNSTGTALVPMANPYKKENETTEEKVVNALDTVIGKLQVLANSGIRGIAEATGYASSEDELGQHERRDVIDTVSSAVHSVTNITGTVNKYASKLAHKATNKARDIVMDKVDDIREDIKVNHNYNSAVEDYKDIGNNENVSDQDKILVQTVMQMAQTATADGDVSTDDISKINNNIEQITDPTIKRRLKASVVPMLNRVNSKATTDVNGETKGGIVGKVLSGVKKGFFFILKPIKAFLSMAWKGIKAFGKKLFSGVIKLFKSGATDVRIGSTALKESLFGVRAQKDKDGNIISEGEDGLFQQFVTNPIKGGIGVVKNLGTAAYYGAKGKLTDALNDPDSKLAKTIESVTNITSSISSSVKDLINSPRKEKEGEDNSEKASNLIGSFKDKFSETEFGKGFMSVFNQAEEEKKKQRLKTPETMTDVNTDEMKQMISGAKESIFTTISKGLDSLINHFVGESGIKTDNGTSNNNVTNSQTEQPTVENAEPTDAASATTASANNNESLTSPDATDVNENGVSGKKNGNALFNIGKMLGGLTKIIGGLGKMVLSIVMGMSGIKAIMSLVENVLKTSLKPLNKLFQSIYKAIKPIVVKLGKIVNGVAKTLTKIGNTVINSISPILEAISPAIDAIFEALDPIFDLISDSFADFVKPITKGMETVVIPVLKRIDIAMGVITGATQMVLGTVQTLGGGLLWGIGSLVDIFVKGSPVKDLGVSWMEQGAGNMFTGWKQEMTSMGAFWKSLVTGVEDKEPAKDITETNIKFNYGDDTVNGSLLDGTLTGSGDQASYGPYMNMGQRGCGPIALADAISRRTGRRVNPADLAASMEARGYYDTNKGTSVSGFINSASAMGVGLNAGAVTRETLMNASSRRPVTVIGSGGAYNTQIGNNHYVNVIGANGSTAIVSNPLTGKVSRAPLNDLILNSKLGLYGSGDVDGFALPDSITEPLSRLKEITGGILNLFSLNDSSSFDAEVESALEEDKYNQVNKELGQVDVDGKKVDKLETYHDAAFEKFKKDHPKMKYETDEDYQKRWETKYRKKYLLAEAEADIKTLQEKDTSGRVNKFTSFMDKYFGKDEDGEYTTVDSEGNATGVVAQMNAVDTSDNILSKLLEAVKSIGSSSGGGSKGSVGKGGGASGVYGGESGKVKMYDFGEVTHPETNITEYDSGESPVHDFFGFMSANEGKAWSSNGFNNWYQKRKNPNKDGEGTVYADPDIHGGIDIQLSTGNEGQPLYAITDGKITDYRYSNSGGNMIRWADADGKEHIYMHMQSLLPELTQGQEIEAGTHVGYVGNTGASGGAHIHYGIYKGANLWGADNAINPLTYWHYIEGSNAAQQGKITDIPAGFDEYPSAWIGKYRDDPECRPFIQKAFNAGMSPAQTAMTFATGIWEDGAKKLFGTKSLTDVTYDYNGQAAVGIFNFVDTHRALEYGTTIEDQLRFVYDNYYTEDPIHSRGRAIDPYRSDYPWGKYYERAFGYKPNMKIGDPIGPHLNEDLVEAASYFTGGALIPEVQYVLKYPRTAVDIYNWMLDEGIATVDGKQSNVHTSKDRVPANKTSSSSSTGSSSGSKTSSSSSSSASNLPMSNNIGPSTHNASGWTVGDYCTFKFGAQYYSGGQLHSIPDSWKNISYEITNIRPDGIITMKGVKGGSVTLDNVYPEYITMTYIDGAKSSRKPTKDANSTNMIRGSGDLPIPEFDIWGSGDYIEPELSHVSDYEIWGGGDDIFGNGTEPVPAYKPEYQGLIDDFLSPTYSDTSSKTTVNAPTYHVYKSTDKLTRMDMINALSNMEFNVSAKKLESLVEKILIKLDEKETNVSIPSVKPSTQSLFNEEIPAQVARLYS